MIKQTLRELHDEENVLILFYLHNILLKIINLDG